MNEVFSLSASWIYPDYRISQINPCHPIIRLIRDADNFDAYFLILPRVIQRQKRFLPRWLLPIGLVLMATFIIAWSLYKDHRVSSAGTGVPVLAANAWNLHKRDSCLRLLQTGDLLLRTGNDMTSRIFRELNQFDKTYSHGGLVVVEGGYPFVYHSIGGEDNPDERLRRDSADFFMSPGNNLGFAIARYRFPDSAAGNLETVIRDYYSRRPLFDMDFNLETDDRLYCSEFVYKAVITATGDTGFIPLTSMLGYRFVGIDNLFMNANAFFVCELKYK